MEEKMDVIRQEILRTTLRLKLNRRLENLRRIRSNLEELKNRLEKQQKETKRG